jgi:uridine kinase
MSAWYDVRHLAKAVQESEPLCANVRLITIDGPAGSGKTQLAAKLASELTNTNVVHMDDLYEGWAKALDPVLFERIRAWIITPLLNDIEIQHLVYDWVTNQYDTWQKYPKSENIILEGVGAGNAQVREFASLALWIEADSELLLDRVVERDGEIVRDEMLIWKSKEDAYFELHNVKAAATIHIRGQSE